jgi:hypothetical protein
LDTDPILLYLLHISHKELSSHLHVFIVARDFFSPPNLSGEQVLVSKPTCSVDSNEQGTKVLGSYVAFKATTTKESQQEESQPQDGVVKDAATLMEGVVEEAQDVGDTIMEELHEADEDNLHFLGMCLTCNLSILPGDVVDAASFLNPPSQKVPSKEPCGDLEAQKKKKEQSFHPAIPLSAYLLLFSAVISLSSGVDFDQANITLSQIGSE